MGNNHQHPGETVAISEVFGLDPIVLRRSPISGRKTWLVVS
jgi:hypothetical protein